MVVICRRFFPAPRTDDRMFCDYYTTIFKHGKCAFLLACRGQGFKRLIPANCFLLLFNSKSETGVSLR